MGRRLPVVSAGQLAAVGAGHPQVVAAAAARKATLVPSGEMAASSTGSGAIVLDAQVNVVPVDVDRSDDGAVAPGAAGFCSDST